MNSNIRTNAPRIEFNRTSQYCYEVFYDRQVLIGVLTFRNRNWVFVPESDTSLGVFTMKSIIEKIDWLETRLSNEEIATH